MNFKMILTMILLICVTVSTAARLGGKGNMRGLLARSSGLSPRQMTMLRNQLHLARKRKYGRFAWIVAPLYSTNNPFLFLARVYLILFTYYLSVALTISIKYKLIKFLARSGGQYTVGQKTRLKYAALYAKILFWISIYLTKCDHIRSHKTTQFEMTNSNFCFYYLNWPNIIAIWRVWIRPRLDLSWPKAFGERVCPGRFKWRY